jgi:hypothetical protein
VRLLHAFALSALACAACTSPHGERPRGAPRVAGTEPPKPAFAGLDANDDGAIDGVEFAALTRQLFVRLDTDGDGNLSDAEYARFMQRPQGPPPDRGGHGAGRGGAPPWGGPP